MRNVVMADSLFVAGSGPNVRFGMALPATTLVRRFLLINNPGTANKIATSRPIPVNNSCVPVTLTFNLVEAADATTGCPCVFFCGSVLGLALATTAGAGAGVGTMIGVGVGGSTIAR